MSQTRYVVLVQQPEDETLFRLVDTEEVARSANAAILTFVGKAGAEGTYVAVPERSWRPREVAVETRREVRVK